MTIRYRADKSIGRAGMARLKVALIPLILVLAASLCTASATSFAIEAHAVADAGQGVGAVEDTATLTASEMAAANNPAAASDDDGEVGVYASFPAETNSSEDLSNLFYYSDSLFANAASAYNDDLACASVNLAAAAANSNTGGDDYSQKACNIKRLLQDIGCSAVEVNAGYENKPAEVTNIGVAIGNKLIHVNGQTYRLFVIGVRGAGYEKEWVSNMKVGDGQSTDGDHQGFQESRDAALGFIMPYIKEHVKPGEHVKIWASGYSRGGVVANMLFAWLDKWIYERNFNEITRDGSYDPDNVRCGGSYNKEEQRFTDTVSFKSDDAFKINESVVFSEEDMYCYPVNPPQGASKADVEACNTNRLTVGTHNLINPDDWIPQVCPNWEGWGFARYGTDHDITCTYAQNRSQAMGDSFANREKSILETNPGSVAATIERLKKIDPNASYLSPQFRQYFFSKSSLSVEVDEMGKGNVFVSKSAEMKYNQGKYYGEFFRFLLKAADCNDCGQYASKLQEDVMYLLGLVFGAPPDKRSEISSVAMKHALAAIEAETGYGIDTLMGKIAIVGNLGSWMADGEEGKAGVPKKILKATLVNTLDELEIAYDEVKVDNASGTAAKIVKGMYAEEQAIDVFSFYHLATVVKAGEGIAQTHWPEAALAWWPEAQEKCVVRVTSATADAGVLAGEGVYAKGENAMLMARAANGYTFAGWYENGIKVSDDAEWGLAVSGNRQIEARWSKQGGDVKQVTFNANDGTDSMVVQKAAKDADVQLRLNEFTRFGYTFKEWNTKADGSGTSYADGASITLNADMTLFAQWQEVHLISLRIEGGTLPELITRRGNEQFGPLPNAKSYLSPGARIVDWTALDGDGNVILESVKETTIVPNEGSLPAEFTLVANVAEPPSRTVRFYANLDDRQQTSDDPLFEVTVYEGGKVRISDDAPEARDIDSGIVRYETPTRDDRVFAGWTTKVDDEGDFLYRRSDTTINYSSIPGEGLDLFALWEQEGLYEVDYRANGGTSADGDLFTVYELGANGKIVVEDNPFTRYGYVFTGWNTKSDGSGLSLQPGAEASLEQLGLPEHQELVELIMNAQTEEELNAALQKATLVLHAQWKKSVASKLPKLETMLNVAKGKAKLAWNAVANAKSYTVAWRVKGGKWKTATTSKRARTISGLKAGKAYQFRVCASNDVSKGNWSKVHYGFMRKTTAVKAKAGKKRMTVTWKRTTGATGYKIMYATNKKMKSAKVAKVAKGSVTKRVIKKLKANKRYYIQVAPLKKAGGATYVGAPSAKTSVKPRR